MHFHDYNESVSVRFVCDKVNKRQKSFGKGSLLTAVMLCNFVYKLDKNKEILMIQIK